MCSGHRGKLHIVFLLLKGSQPCNKGLTEVAKDAGEASEKGHLSLLGELRKVSQGALLS